MRETTQSALDWRRYPNFRPEEFRCRHTGRLRMDPGFMERLQRLRSAYGRSMAITSGYRDPTHPTEAAKTSSGAHTLGRACDVAVHGRDALDLVVLAVAHGFTGIGVQQRGLRRFIHLDDLDATTDRPRPTLWSYA